MNKLEITTRIGCKCNCYFCPQDKITKSFASSNRPGKNHKQIMSLDDFKFMIDKVPSEVTIEFAGMAEPWLNKDCTKMLLYANYKGHPIGVYTTAVNMTKDDIDNIKIVPFTTFRLHVPDNSNFMKIDPDNKYIETIEYLLNSNINNINIMSMNKVHKKLEHIVGKYYRDVMTDRAGNLSVASSIPVQSSQFKTGPLTCAWTDTFKNNVLLPDGTVLLCCMCYSMEHILGNLMDQSYESLFTGFEHQNIIRALSNKSNYYILCRSCSASIPKADTGDNYEL